MSETKRYTPYRSILHNPGLQHNCTSLPGMSLLLNVYREDGMAPRRLVVHVGAGRRPIEGPILEAGHGLLLGPDGPGCDADLQKK